MYRLKYLWELPPKTVARRIKNRLFPRRNTLDVEALLESSKLRPQRFYDFLNRYETILTRACGWRPLSFEGRHVLELGCGPFVGWGPLAIFKGAESYTAIEPWGSDAALTSPQLIDRYFKVVFKDLTALLGERGDFASFMRELREKTTVVSRPLLEANDIGPFDIVLSNSCLEHIFPFEQSIERLQKLVAPDSACLHLVDFGNHRQTLNPFQGMYSTPPDAYRVRYGDAINLKRAPDMLRAFQQADFDVAMVPYTEFLEEFGNDEPLQEYWAQSYGKAELFVKTAIIYGPASR